MSEIINKIAEVAGRFPQAVSDVKIIQELSKLKALEAIGILDSIITGKTQPLPAKILNLINNVKKGEIIISPPEKLQVQKKTPVAKVQKRAPIKGKTGLKKAVEIEPVVSEADEFLEDAPHNEVHDELKDATGKQSVLADVPQISEGIDQDTEEKSKSLTDQATSEVEEKVIIPELPQDSILHEKNPVATMANESGIPDPESVTEVQRIPVPLTVAETLSGQKVITSKNTKPAGNSKGKNDDICFVKGEELHILGIKCSRKKTIWKADYGDGYQDFAKTSVFGILSGRLDQIIRLHELENVDHVKVTVEGAMSLFLEGKISEASAKTKRIENGKIIFPRFLFHTITRGVQRFDIIVDPEAETCEICDEGGNPINPKVETVKTDPVQITKEKQAPYEEGIHYDTIEQLETRRNVLQISDENVMFDKARFDFKNKLKESQLCSLQGNIFIIFGYWCYKDSNNWYMNFGNGYTQVSKTSTVTQIENRLNGDSSYTSISVTPVGAMRLFLEGKITVNHIRSKKSRFGKIVFCGVSFKSHGSSILLDIEVQPVFGLYEKGMNEMPDLKKHVKKVTSETIFTEPIKLLGVGARAGGTSPIRMRHHTRSRPTDQQMPDEGVAAFIKACFDPAVDISIHNQAISGKNPEKSEPAALSEQKEILLPKSQPKAKAALKTECQENPEPKGRISIFGLACHSEGNSWYMDLGDGMKTVKKDYSAYGQLSKLVEKNIAMGRLSNIGYLRISVKDAMYLYLEGKLSDYYIKRLSDVQDGKIMLPKITFETLSEGIRRIDIIIEKEFDGEAEVFYIGKIKKKLKPAEKDDMIVRSAGYPEQEERSPFYHQKNYLSIIYGKCKKCSSSNMYFEEFTTLAVIDICLTCRECGTKSDKFIRQRKSTSTGEIRISIIDAEAISKQLSLKKQRAEKLKMDQADKQKIVDKEKTSSPEEDEDISLAQDLGDGLGNMIYGNV